MSTSFMQRVDERRADALASGALLPVEAQEIELVDQGLRFVVRWVSSLSAKDSANVAMPGGPRDPSFNPFLEPEPALTVGPVGEHHLAILNKFPVTDRHLVLARREFQEQQSPLTLEDFSALSMIMSSFGGLGFYNGGTAAGASQRHKHLQWIPTAPGNASLSFFVQGLPADLPLLSPATHALLPIRHLFVRTRCGLDTDAQDSARSMLEAFEFACRELGMAPDNAGLLPACNVLVEDGWMLLVPRSREHVGAVSVNALSYGGTLYVRHPEQVDPIRDSGPLTVLIQAACA